MSKAVKLPDHVGWIAVSKPGLEEGRREDIRSIWDSSALGFKVYKTAEDVKAGSGDRETTTRLNVGKDEHGTWDMLEQIMDMTSEDFDAAVFKYRNS